MLPEYAACRCGEYRLGALRLVNNVVSCHCCADYRHRKGLCISCFGFQRPIEWHHTAGKEYSGATVPLCLNCHGAISERQREWPRLFSSINYEGLTESQAMVMFGVVELVALSWECACLRSESTWRRGLLIGYAIVGIAHGFLKAKAHG